MTSSGFAYPSPVDFNGDLARWNITIDDPPILYDIEVDNDEEYSYFSTMVDSSADLWTDVPSSYFALQRAAASEMGQVTIHFQDNIDMPDTAGYTIFDESNDHGPVHCSIYIGTSQNRNPLAMAKTILHELGHCAGLGHSLIPEAIMSYYFEDNDFELDIDDRAALTRMYPIDGSRPKLAPGCAVGVNSGKRNPLHIYFFLILPLLIITMYRFGFRISLKKTN